MYAIYIVTFVCGVILLQQSSSLPDARLLWLAVAALASLLLTRRSAIRLPALLLLGYLWAAGAAHLRLNDALPHQWERQSIELSGFINDIPQPKADGFSLTFTVEQVITPNALVPQHIQLFWRSPASVPQAGERWLLHARLQRPHGMVNPNGFDLEGWLLQQGIGASGSVDNHYPAQRNPALVYRPAALLARWRASIDRLIHLQVTDQRIAGTLAALVVGTQNEISRADWQLYRATGTAHLISISGLHITMLAGLAMAAAGFFWRRSARLVMRLPVRDAALLAGLAAAWLYAALAGFGIPAQRTLYMLTTLALLFLLRRTTSPVNALATALLAVCLLDPWAVLSAGFWLSFGAVGTLLWAGHGRITAESGWRAAVRAQYAITIGLIPLSLWLFQQTSLISPLANAFAIPVVSLIVVPLALAGVALPLGDLALQLAAQIMQWVITLLTWLDSAGISMLTAARPSLWQLMLALIGVAWLLLPKGFPARWSGLLALLPLFWPVNPPLPPGAFTVTMLDIGQGTAVVVQSAQHVLLYDTGPRYGDSSDAGERVIAPYLRSQGISRLSGMVVSHNDADHTGGMLSVLHALPVDWLLTSIPPQLNPAGADIRLADCRAGQQWQWDGVSYSVLYPPAELHPDSDNNSSCVVRVSSPAGSVLLTGDIEAAAEHWLVEHDPADLPVTALLVPHHGSRTSSTNDFVAASRSQIALISAGYHNRYGHPKAEILQRYVRAGSTISRTDRQGAVTLRFMPGAPVTNEAERIVRPHYWQDMP